ncbi:hypothetical protein D3C85_1419110 [compost metagenome]
MANPALELLDGGQTAAILQQQTLIPDKPALGAVAGGAIERYLHLLADPGRIEPQADMGDAVDAPYGQGRPSQGGTGERLATPSLVALPQEGWAVRGTALLLIPDGLPGCRLGGSPLGGTDRAIAKGVIAGEPHQRRGFAAALLPAVHIQLRRRAAGGQQQ